MPYITEMNKRKLAHRDNQYPETAGELNYCFTKLIIGYLKAKGTNYQHINDVVGALEGAKLELYRRLVAPYEDTKIELNGEVYNESNT